MALQLQASRAKSWAQLNRYQKSLEKSYERSTGAAQLLRVDLNLGDVQFLIDS